MDRLRRRCVTSLAVAVAQVLCVARGSCPGNVVLPPEHFTVAVAADVSLDNMPDTFRSMANENPNVVVVNGDIGYYDLDPSAPIHFMGMFNDVFGPTMPLFLTKGNHDENGNNWERDNGYSSLLAARWQNAGNLDDFACKGKWGVNQSCKHRGVAFTFATHGCEACLYGPSYGICDDSCQASPGFQTNALQDVSTLWRVCMWHKNMQALQIGGKADEAGYEPYEECRQAGALIVTGHEHSYERTRTLTSMRDQIVDPDWTFGDILRLKEGSSFVVVGALGGYNQRVQRRCLPTQYPYGCKGEWAKILSASQPEVADVGSTFVVFRFHLDGNPCKAVGKLVSTTGEVLDEFEFYSQVALSTYCCPSPPDLTNMTPYATATSTSSDASTSRAGTSHGKSKAEIHLILFLSCLLFGLLHDLRS